MPSLTQEAKEADKRFIGGLLGMVKAVNLSKRYFVDHYKNELRMALNEAIDRVRNGITPEVVFQKLQKDEKFHAYCMLMDYDYFQSIFHVLKVIEGRRNLQINEPEDVLKWFMVDYTRDVPDNLRRDREQRMQKEYQNLFCTGYRRDLKQQSVSLFLYKDELLEPQLAEVKKVLQYIKPEPKWSGPEYRDPGKEGYQFLSISEHTCSQKGSYLLFVKGDTAIISRQSYGSMSDIFEGTLTEAIEQIQKKYWYDKKYRINKK